MRRENKDSEQDPTYVLLRGLVNFIVKGKHGCVKKGKSTKNVNAYRLKR